MKKYHNDFLQSIGNTPLIKLKAASEITGCNIFGKAEYLNPGGSVKDRAALALIKDAENKLSYDLYYIKNFSSLLDFLILLKILYDQLKVFLNLGQP